MGRVNEQVKYFTENLDYKMAKNRSEQIKNLVEQLGKNVAKAYKIKDGYEITITSQELRSFQIKLAKIHKEMNKKVDFIEFEKRIEKLAQKNKGKTLDETHTMHWDIFKEQVKLEKEIVLALQNIQWAVSKTSMLCTILNIYEYTLKRDKETKEKEDADILTHCIFEALVEASEL